MSNVSLVLEARLMWSSPVNKVLFRPPDIGHWTLDMRPTYALKILNIDRFNLIRQIKTKHS